MQAKGVADAGSAAFRVSGLELGGLFGSLLAGRISDYLIASKPKGGNVGKRVQARPGSRDRYSGVVYERQSCVRPARQPAHRAWYRRQPLIQGSKRASVCNER